MLAKWSSDLVSMLAEQGIIEESKRDIYVYGFEILLSTLLNALAITVIAVLTSTVMVSVAFVVFFGSIRVFAGGYHAGTHLRCFLLFGAIYIIFLLAVNNLLVPHPLISYVGIGSALLGGGTIWALAPVEDDNRPLTTLERVTLRRKSRAIALFQAVIILFAVLVTMTGWGLLWLEPLLFGMSAGLITATFSLVAGAIKNKDRPSTVHLAN